jgi:hypothetical protein
LNLIENPSLEYSTDNKLPPHWEPFVVSVPGKFSLDIASLEASVPNVVKITASANVTRNAR